MSVVISFLYRHTIKGIVDRFLDATLGPEETYDTPSTTPGDQ